MSFTSPLALLLLLLLPFFVWQAGIVQNGVLRYEKREIASLVLRLVIVLCLILALAGMEITRGGNELAVVFLVDVSDSMPEAAVNSALDYVRQAMNAMTPEDRAAVILFGGDALVERPMLPGKELGVVTSVPVTTQTDLAEAIQLGLALFPSESARRMVILSDGAQTTGDALKAAELAAASGVQIIVVPFIAEPEAEALVTALEAPARLRPGEQFDLKVSVQANRPTRATLRVLADGTLLYEQAHELRRGTQTFSLPLVNEAQNGILRYIVEISPQDDTFYQNNRLYAFSKIEGPPRLLMSAPLPGERLPGGSVRPDEHSALLAALQAAGYTVEFVPPNRLPADLPGLAGYNALILVNLPARDLSPRQMETIQAYVRDLGGGLLVVGGPTSYGVGGYFQTPLEETLPVEMQIKDQQRRPSIAIVFIIDHSGSMGETSGGVNKLELAKEAAARSIDLLFPTDRVGVIEFDDSAAWVVPMTTLNDPSAVKAAIGSIQVGGGTDIMAGLQAMARVLPGDPARVKHVILLTDGIADPTGIPELVQNLYTEYGITLSTVAVGRDAAPFLKDLAKLGNGRYHFTADASTIPSIFTEETTLASRAYIEEGLFAPQQTNPSPILSGVESLPPLYGYVASSPKALAQVILTPGGPESSENDPLLAVWQYGMGRAAAFTSDATGRWARDWVGWAGYPVFWAQVTRYVLGELTTAQLQMDVRQQGETARLSLEARDIGGAFLNGYQINANVIAPNGNTLTIPLRQSAPGRYEGVFRPEEAGVYLFRFDAHSEAAAFSETLGWALPYSPEYRAENTNPELLLRLAALTGGGAASASPAEAFRHDLKGARAARPAWPWLVALATLLLPFDIAIRRLVLTRQDWEQIRHTIRTRFLRSTPQPAPVTVSTPSMEALRKAKQRVIPTVPPANQTSQEGAEIKPFDFPASMPSENLSTSMPSQPTDGTASDSIASTLLAKKRNRR
ncbi:MAG: VWA domain-containing protein [Anaerolineales bacterium]|nr:VWA domain-containing protein [Anaerolineales bacterium]